MQVCYNDSMLLLCYSDGLVCESITPETCGVAPDCDLGYDDCGTNTPQCLKLTFEDVPANEECYEYQDAGGGEPALDARWSDLPDLNDGDNGAGYFILQNLGGDDCDTWELEIELGTDVTRTLYVWEGGELCSGDVWLEETFDKLLLRAKYYPDEGGGATFQIIVYFINEATSGEVIVWNKVVAAATLTDCGTVADVPADDANYPQPYGGGTATTERYTGVI